MVKRFLLLAAVCVVIAVPGVHVATVVGLALGLPVSAVVGLGLLVYAPVYAWAVSLDLQREAAGYHWAA